MGWNTAVLYVKGVAPAEALAALAIAEPMGDWVGPDEATSAARGDLLFAAESGGWSQIWNPSQHLVLGYGSTFSEALTVFFSSVASTYGFTWYANGGAVRAFVVSEGTVVVDEGEPLPVEASTTLPSWGPDEDFLWAVIEAVTGTTYDESVRYQAYRLRDPAGS